MFNRIFLFVCLSFCFGLAAANKDWSDLKRELESNEGSLERRDTYNLLEALLKELEKIGPGIRPSELVFMGYVKKLISFDKIDTFYCVQNYFDKLGQYPSRVKDSIKVLHYVMDIEREQLAACEHFFLKDLTKAVAMLKEKDRTRAMELIDNGACRPMESHLAKSDGNGESELETIADGVLAFMAKLPETLYAKLGVDKLKKFKVFRQLNNLKWMCRRIRGKVWHPTSVYRYLNNKHLLGDLDEFSKKWFQVVDTCEIILTSGKTFKDVIARKIKE